MEENLTIDPHYSRGMDMLVRRDRVTFNEKCHQISLMGILKLVI